MLSPEGLLKIARHFSAGLALAERSTRPGGTTETLRHLQTIANVLPSLWDSDTFDQRAPSTEVLGYDRTPFRGKDFLAQSAFRHPRAPRRDPGRESSPGRSMPGQQDAPPASRRRVEIRHPATALEGRRTGDGGPPELGEQRTARRPAVRPARKNGPAGPTIRRNLFPFSHLRPAPKS